MSGYDTREWRVGSHYGVHLYAVADNANRDDDEPIASCLGPPEQAQQHAEQVVREHAMLSAPYADDQHKGGHWLDVLPQRPRWSIGPEGVFTGPLPSSTHEADEQVWRVHDQLRKLGMDLVAHPGIAPGNVADIVHRLADQLTAARWRPKKETS